MLKSREKKERALGTRLFLKGERCSSPKCAMVRRPSRPGPHKKPRRALSEYGQQLAEKQKIMFSYGLREAQMRKIFKEALKKKKVVTETVLDLLERRLDNVIFRLGFASSRISARQYVSHGHILVNGRKTNVPSYQVKKGDIIKIKPSSLNCLIFKDLLSTIKKHEAPFWLELDKENLEGKVKSAPSDVEMSFGINLVVDFYSK